MRHRSLVATILALVFSCSSAASPARPSHWPVCAELDAAAMWHIEEAGEAQQISGEKVAAAFFLVMRARRACAGGASSQRGGWDLRRRFVRLTSHLTSRHRHRPACVLAALVTVQSGGMASQQQSSLGFSFDRWFRDSPDLRSQPSPARC